MLQDKIKHSSDQSVYHMGQIIVLEDHSVNASIMHYPDKVSAFSKADGPYKGKVNIS